MKSLSHPITSQTLARHEDRAPQRRPASPRTDCHFHAPAEDAAAVRDQRSTTTSAELRAFRQIGHDYLGEKAHRGYLVDFVVYALITGLCIWSLIAVGILVVQAMTA